MYSPIKPKGKIDIKEIIASIPNKALRLNVTFRFDTLICEDTNFEDIEDKAAQLMERKILNKMKASDNQPKFVNI